jgi:hypothetical protein
MKKIDTLEGRAALGKGLNSLCALRIPNSEIGIMKDKERK